MKDNIVAKSLKEVTFFAATTDLWSSDSCHPYLTLTVHFVSSNWDLKSFFLVRVLVMLYLTYLITGT